MAKDLEFATRALNDSANQRTAAKLWEKRIAARAVKGAGMTTALLTLAACGGSSDPAVEEAALYTLNSVNQANPIQIAGTTIGAIIDVKDIAGDVYSGVEVSAAGSAAAGDKLVFRFVDGNAEDTVILTSASVITGFSVIEIVNGTVDFTAIGGAALSNTTLIVGSEAILTGDQLASLTAIELRAQAVSGTVTVEFAVGDDFAAMLALISSSTGITFAIEAEDGALTYDQSTSLTEGGASVSGTAGAPVVPTLTLVQAVELGDGLTGPFLISDADIGSLAFAAAAGAVADADSVLVLAENAADFAAGPIYTLSDESLNAADLMDQTVAGLADAQGDAVAAVRTGAVVAGAVNGDTIVINNGTYTLLDTAANLVAANPDVLAEAVGVRSQGNTTLAQADAIAAATTASVTATVVLDPTSAWAVSGFTDINTAFVLDLLSLEAGNAWSFAIVGSRTAEELMALDSITTAVIDATGVTQVTGSAADLLAVTSAPGVDLPTFFNLVVTGGISIADIQVLDTRNGVGTLTYDLNDMAANLVANAGNYVPSAGSVTVVGAATAAQLNAIDALLGPNATLTVSEITDVAANVAAVDALIGGVGVGSNADVTIIGAISAANANALMETTGVVTATVTAGTAAALNAALGDVSGDNLTLTVLDLAPVLTVIPATAAADLLALISGGVVNATAVTAISGTAAQITALLEEVAGIGLTLGAAVDFTVTDQVSISDLVLIDAATTGDITAASVKGSVVELTGSPFAVAATSVLVEGEATVAQINALDLATAATLTFNLTDGAAALALVGNAAVVAAATAVTITGAASAAQIVAIDAATTATITASSVVDTAANIATVAGAIAGLAGDAPTVTITGEVAAGGLVALNGLLGNADAGVVTATVAADQAGDLVAALTNLSATDVLTLTVLDGGLVATAAADLLDLATAGSVDASDVAVVTGSAADILAVVAGDYSLQADVGFVVTGVPTLDDLAEIDAATTGAVTFADVSGSIAALSTSAYVSGSVNVMVEGGASIVQLFNLETMTNGALDFDLRDSAANLVNNAGGVNAELGYVGTANSVTITGAASVAQIGAIFATATSPVTGTSIVDAVANIASVAPAANLLTSPVPVTITGDVAGGNVATLNLLMANPDVTVVTATVAADTAGDLRIALSNLDASDVLSLTVLEDVGATDVVTLLDLATAGTVAATDVTQITGSAADILALIGAETAGGFSLSASVAFDVTGTPTLAELAAIDAATTGVVSYDAVSGSAADLAASAGVYVTDAVNVTITGAATLAEYRAIDNANGLGTIILGQAGFADTYANLLANVGGYLNTEAATVTDGPITVAEALALQAITTGPVTATISDPGANEPLLLETNFVETGNLYTASVTFADVEAANIPQNSILDNVSTLTVTGDAFSNHMDFAQLTADLVVEGADRDDVIIGGSGDDVLSGGAGLDVILGGLGADVITGGADVDVIAFDTVAESAATVAATTLAGFDTVTDFGASDIIDLSSVNQALTGGAAASVITLTQLALTDTTIADFSELAAAILADAGLDASSGAGLQAYLVDLTGNTGALGTGSYLLVNDNDTTMDGGDLMVMFSTPPQDLDAQSFAV
jgi:hypothetical protein